MRLLSLSAAAVAGLTAVLAPAAPALAAPHHAHVSSSIRHGAHVAVRPAHRAHDRLAGPRTGVAHVVAAQVQYVNRLIAAEKASTTLNPTDQAALVAAAGNDLAALTTDQAAVPTATTFSALRTVAVSALRTRQVAQFQFGVVSAADAQEAQAAELAVTGTDLKSQVDAAAAAGTDVTAATAALADLDTQLATVNAGAPTAVSAILAVSPTASSTDLRTALTGVHATLEADDAALTAAQADITTVQTVLAG